jgi:hypothetical protein
LRGWSSGRGSTLLSAPCHWSRETTMSSTWSLAQGRNGPGSLNWSAVCSSPKGSGCWGRSRRRSYCGSTQPPVSWCCQASTPPVAPMSRDSASYCWRHRSGAFRLWPRVSGACQRQSFPAGQASSSPTSTPRELPAPWRRSLPAQHRGRGCRGGLPGGRAGSAGRRLRDE